MRPPGQPESSATPSAAAGWYAVAILWLAYICSFVDRQVLALLVDPIKLSLGIGDTQVSLLQGLAFGLFYALMGVPCGALVDRYDRRTIVAAGIALWSLATMVCGFATGFWILFTARMLVGIGEATLSPGALSLLSDLFPRERRVLPLSIYISAAAFGGGLAMLVGGAAISYITAHPLPLPFGGTLEPWRAAFVMVGAPGLAIALLLRTMPEPPRTADGASVAVHGGWSDAWRFMVERRDLFLRHYGGLALYALLAYAILAWGPAYFMRVHGWTLPQTGLRFGATYLVAGTLGAVAGGMFAARLRRLHVDGNLRSASIAITAFVLPAIAAPLMSDPWVSLGLYGVAIFFTSFPGGSSVTAITEVTPGRLRGQVSAYYYLAMAVVGFTLGPLSVALLNDYAFEDPRRVGDSLAVVAALVGVARGLADGRTAYRSGAGRRTSARRPPTRGRRQWICCSSRKLWIIDVRSRNSRARGHRSPRHARNRLALLPLDVRDLRSHQRLVRDGVLLHELHAHLPPLAVVEREQFAGIATGMDADQLVRKVPRIVDPAIHAHAAERVVDVRGIAREQHAAAVVGARDALVHAVERAVHELVGAVVRGHVMQALLDPAIRQPQRIVLDLRVGGDQHAPQ